MTFSATTTQDKLDGHNRHWFFITLLFLLTLIIYSNSWQASWHFDDWHNIVFNRNLHLDHLNLSEIRQTFYASPKAKNRLYRPVACFTFALNWYFSQNRPKAYHAVNFIIHFATASFLFLTLLTVFKTPKLRNRYKKDVFFICALTTILWAVNPIQTQAVIYIVQRMTSLAALFYIIGMFFYLKARLTDSRKKRPALFTGCAACFFLALLSKENAATFPFALLLAEWAFFQKGPLKPPSPKKVLSLTLCLALLLGVLFLLFGNPLKGVLSIYSHRQFSMTERLLTQPRIIFFYLSQIFYPLPDRLCLEHQFDISTTIFTPWTTLPAILGIAVLLGAGCLWLRKFPLVGFPILFFFLNHIIESSIIPLELIFEHRNYLPSLFLFLPVALGLSRMLQRYHDNNSFIFVLGYGSIALIILFFGLGTYVRNMAWATEKTLWEDVLAKKPDSHRAYHNLAWGYYQRMGMTSKAIEYYHRALANPKTIGPDTLKNLALLYLQYKQYNQTVYYAREAIRLTPYFDNESYFYLAMALTKQQKWNVALEQIDILLSKAKNNADYYRLKGLILINRGNYNEALYALKQSLWFSPNNADALTYIGAAYTKLDKFTRADWFFKRSHALHPDNQLNLLCALTNSLKQRGALNFRKYMEQLIARLPAAQTLHPLPIRIDPDVSGLISEEMIYRELKANAIKIACHSLE